MSNAIINPVKSSSLQFVTNSVVNVIFVAIMIGMFYNVYTDPTFVPKDNLITLFLAGSAIVVLSILILVGLGYACIGVFNKDLEKSQEALTTANFYEMIAYVIIIIIGIVGCIFVLNTTGSNTTESSPYGTFLMFNAIAACIGQMLGSN
jgi:hypothetical protein